MTTFFKYGFRGKYEVEDLTAASTLLETDSGKTFMLNSTTEFTTTLPALSDAGSGWNCRFVVKSAPSGANYVVTENAASDTDKIVVNGINELEVDTGDDGVSNTGCTNINFIDGTAIEGDWVEIFTDGTKWYATGQTKADGGITAT